MLKQVFISYRHESPEHSRAVRRLGESLRQAGIPVLLDQFYLEEYPGGPNEGWPKWCEDCATRAECVLIIASQGWFSAYNNTEPSGIGLGAATEAILFRQDLYDNKGHNERIRLTFFHKMSDDAVPKLLRPWHQFRLFDHSGSDQMNRWVAERLDLQITEASTIQWPSSIHFQLDIANRNKNEWPAIVDLLAGKFNERILFFEGSSGLGKSELVRHAKSYAARVGIPTVFVDFKGGTRKIEDILGQIDLDLGAHLPHFSIEEIKKTYTLRKDLRALRRPVLFIFDSYEDAAGNQNIAEWLNVQFLGDLGSAPAVAVIIAGQKVPDRTHTSWRHLARYFLLEPIEEFEHWKDWASRKYPNVTENVLNTLLQLAEGQPSLMVVYCQRMSKAGIQ
jgi:hypothetical protein